MSSARTPSNDNTWWQVWDERPLVVQHTLVDWFERWNRESYKPFFPLLMRRVLWHLWEAGASITEDDNDCSFFTGIISQEQQQLYDDASIVNEASSINEHTIADDLGQPCHRWGICNFNLQQDGWKQLFSAAAALHTIIKINEVSVEEETKLVTNIQAAVIDHGSSNMLGCNSSFWHRPIFQRAHVLSFHVETKPSIYLLRTQPKKQASTTTMQRWAAWLMDGHYKAIHIRTRFKKHTFRSCTTIRDKSKIRTFTNAEIYGSRAHF